MSAHAAVAVRIPWRAASQRVGAASDRAAEVGERQSAYWDVWSIHKGMLR